MKKGISPLIATVLIIGFTIGLAVIIFLWSTTFTKDLTESTGEEAITKLQILSGVGIKIEKIFYKDLDLYLKIRNKKSTPIEQLKVRITDIVGNSDSIDLVNPIPDTPLIEGFGIKDINTGYSKFDIAKIEVTPIVIINEELVSASNIIEEFFASAGFIDDSIVESGIVSSVSFDSSIPSDLLGSSIITVGTTYVSGVSYDGSGVQSFGEGDYISLGDGNTLSFETNDAFSISVWVNPSVDGSTTKLIFRKIENPVKGYQLSRDNNRARFFMGDGVGFFNIAGNGLTIPKDQWTHLVVTYGGGGTKEDIEMYQNSNKLGVFRTSNPPGYTDMGSIVNNGNPIVGGDDISLLSSFIGMIDDVQVFNKVLSQAEIDSLYNT